MKLRVGDYMTKNVITLSPDNTVDEAIELIQKTGHDGFPVVDDSGKVIGYISSRDLLKKDPNTKIGDIMSKQLYVAREYMDLRDAARVMFRTGHSKLPVVDDDGRLLGIISNADVIRSQIERADPGKVEKLKKTIEKVHGVNIEVERGKVEVDRLIPTQTKVFADELKGRIYELRRGLAEPIVVIKKGGRLYLVDGHHRVVAAKKIGVKTLDAYILKVPENVELGIERLVKKRGIKSIRDIEIIEDVPHPLVEITFRNTRR
ncbi:CBS domain-containing ParB/RepB/Spo0J family partition protein [Archaeoglobus veneficus]|uniref:CBS domain containing protein n=1 Tax=Archaeoglobus veneficus (strain DSM 11195 / SNP6) TaxID=693661 RepID=F2KMV7_ARCVS|nr:CBS domain-containing protein [Archaeoglobus veneficus]AEA46131.1 CBS domain containing protein [Archaeoglobus veneficus SNP6]